MDLKINSGMLLKEIDRKDYQKTENVHFHLIYALSHEISENDDTGFYTRKSL